MREDTFLAKGRGTTNWLPARWSKVPFVLFSGGAGNFEETVKLKLNS